MYVNFQEKENVKIVIFLNVTWKHFPSPKKLPQTPLYVFVKHNSIYTDV